MKFYFSVDFWTLDNERDQQPLIFIWRKWTEQLKIGLEIFKWKDVDRLTVHKMLRTNKIQFGWVFAVWFIEAIGVERIELQCGWKSSKEGKADSFSISKSNGDEYFLKDLLVYFVNTFATFEISETRLTETTKYELFFFLQVGPGL